MAAAAVSPANRETDSHRFCLTWEVAKTALSKSTYLKGTQCHKYLYLYKHHYKLQDPVSASQQAVFDRGHAVGELAQQLFPGGVDCSPPKPWMYFDAIRDTARQISRGQDTIYEAWFGYEEEYAALDILVKRDGKWYGFEVKSSTEVKEVYLDDVAFQYHVIRGSGMELEDLSIVYIDNTYERHGPLELENLFRVESVLDEARTRAPVIPERIAEFKEVIRSKETPEVPIGPHCFDPYGCAFIGHCWPDLPKDNVFGISRIGAKAWELFEQGIHSAVDVPEDFPLSKRQSKQVEVAKSREPAIQKEPITEFLKDLTYPLQFLDYETFNPAVPLFDRSRPYQMIQFQWSLHRLETAGGEASHCDFLGDGVNDPRREFAESLIEAAGTKGNILVWNIGFERKQTEELVELFPDLSDELLALTGRMVDLMIPFARQWYLHPDQHGSASIKAVLPVLVPGFSYEGMDVADGQDAMLAYNRLADPALSEADRMAIRRSLLEYCRLDTEAMLRIHTALHALLDS